MSPKSPSRWNLGIFFARRQPSSHRERILDGKRASNDQIRRSSIIGATSMDITSALGHSFARADARCAIGTEMPVPPADQPSLPPHHSTEEILAHPRFGLA